MSMSGSIKIMSWRKLTEDDVWSGMSSPEVTAVRTKLLTSGQSSPLKKIIEQVTLEARTAVKSCADNVPSPDEEEIPAGLVYHCAAIARYRALSRFGLVIEHGGDSRLEEYRSARAYLKCVAKCEIKMDRYGAAEDEATPKHMKPRISARSRRFSRGQQEGI